jgi:hypothetical protein
VKVLEFVRDLRIAMDVDQVWNEGPSRTGRFSNQLASAKILRGGVPVLRMIEAVSLDLVEGTRREFVRRDQ